jgi:hypothetical protein
MVDKPNDGKEAKIKVNKKRIIILIVCICFLSGCAKVEELTSLMDYGDYQKINEYNIKKIEIVKYTEGGDDTQEVQEDDFPRIYNNLKDIKIGKETTRACEDNTTVYKFTLQDDTQLKVEIECDWVIINNKRYIIEK